MQRKIHFFVGHIVSIPEIKVSTSYLIPGQILSRTSQDTPYVPRKGLDKTPLIRNVTKPITRNVSSIRTPM